MVSLSTRTGGWAARLAPPRWDALIAAGFVVLTVLEGVFGTSERPLPVHLLLTVPALGALAWRRRAPLLVAALVTASVVTSNQGGQLTTVLAIVFVSFTVGGETDPPRNWIGLLTITVPLMTGMILIGLEVSDIAALFVFAGGPWTVGVVVRQRVARAGAAVERAALLERDRDQQGALAAAEERTRIARELHDIVSHSISVIAIQTQAVRRRLLLEQTREAADLAAIEATARESLAEMRRIFGVLRADGENVALAPQPGLEQLDALLAQVRGAGLPVNLHVSGESTPLPPGADLAAYRIVQEGLTNALRHAEASVADVTLAYGLGRLEITIDDDGVGQSIVTRSAAASGHGLVGVRERVGLYGGDVSTEVSPAGGFRLRATLPREAAR